jgi:CheY-like chemotaxis protein
MKILIAEDRNALRAAIKFLMDDWGYEVDFASNGVEAVEKAIANHYDLCLMDLHMPLLSGREAARILRQRAKTFPILALTASPLSEKKECLADGFNDFMEKPYDCFKLHEKIKELTAHVALA